MSNDTPQRVSEERLTELISWYDGEVRRMRDYALSSYPGAEDTASCLHELLAARPALEALVRALTSYVTASKSWHDFHHGSNTIQCDWICECIAAGEEALKLANIPLHAEKCHGLEMESMARELLSARPALEALREAREALAYLVADSNAWVASLSNSLNDPDYGIALKDREKFLADVREEISLRKRHAEAVSALLPPPKEPRDG